MCTRRALGNMVRCHPVATSSATTLPPSLHPTRLSGACQKKGQALATAVAATAAAAIGAYAPPRSSDTIVSLNFFSLLLSYTLLRTPFSFQDAPGPPPPLPFSGSMEVGRPSLARARGGTSSVSHFSSPVQDTAHWLQYVPCLYVHTRKARQQHSFLALAISRR